MFTKLSIRNFKAWKGLHTVDLKPITLLLGTNSAGKTSLLQPLLLLRQTVDSPDRHQALNLGGQPGDILHLGTMQDVLYGHKSSLELTFELEFISTVVTEDEEKSGDDWTTSEQAADRARCVIHIDYGATPHGAAFVHRMSYEHAGSKFEIARQNGQTYTLSTTPPVPGLLAEPSVAKRSYAPERSVGLSAEAVAAFGLAGAMVQDWALLLTRELQAIGYLGPLRDSPARTYAWNGQMPGQVGVKGELAVQALLASANLSLKEDSPFARGDLVERASTWLKKMEVADGLVLERQGKSSSYEVVVVRGGQRANLVDVGFGVSQVLPVIALAYFVPKGSTIILEQPEIHLHPLAQTALADLFVEVARERKVQFLVETHSEHLFRRLQSRIADMTMTPDQCALYFVDHAQDGSALLKTLDVDEFGRVKNWPPRFFGDAMGEVERQTRQALLRKQRERSGG